MTRIKRTVAMRLLVLACLIGSLSGPLVHGAEDATTASTQFPHAGRLPRITPSREAAALAFVEQHRPEMLELVALVREKNTAEYQQAIGQFFLWSEQVANAGGQDHGSVGLALQAWQNKVETQILGAQLMRNPDQSEELREELKKVIEASVDIHLAQIDLQIAIAKQRLDALQQQKEAVVEERESLIQDRLAGVEQLVAKHRQREGLPENFEAHVRKIQEAAAKRQQQGDDVSAIARLMEQLGPLVNEGKFDEATSVLKQASELLQP